MHVFKISISPVLFLVVRWQTFSNCLSDYVRVAYLFYTSYNLLRMSIGHLEPFLSVAGRWGATAPPSPPRTPVYINTTQLKLIKVNQPLQRVFEDDLLSVSFLSQQSREYTVIPLYNGHLGDRRKWPL